MLRKYLKCALQQVSRSTTILNGQFATFATSVTTNPIEAPKSTTDLSKELHLPEFTPEECTKILSIINNSDAEKLLSYEISKARAQKLHSWKVRNGPLSTLGDILFVEGFGLKMATKFCQSLLAPPNETDAVAVTNKTARTAPYITPSMDEQQRRCITSCASVRIGVASVTWSHLKLAPASENSPCLLTDWQHHEIVDKKLHLSDLVQRCLYVAQQIPTADCYLFENPQMAQASNNPGSVEQQNINIQKAQITAVLSYALTARSIERAKAVEQYLSMHEEQTLDEDDQQSVSQQTAKTKAKTSVYYLRRFLTARLFNHLVGTERVSSEDTVLKLMRTHYNQPSEADYIIEDESALETQLSPNASDERLSIRGNVHFPMELRKMFAGMERYQREFLGQSLLLNLAFVRLVLLQDPTSIDAVSNRSTKKVVN